MGAEEKNGPVPTLDTIRFWKGCKRRKLLIQHCHDCHQYQFYPRNFCSSCMSADVEYVNASGIGKVKSYTIVHRAISPAYANEVPYVIALIELEEGPVMMSNIIDCDLKDVSIGKQVQVVFEDWTDEITIPKFTLV